MLRGIKINEFLKKGLIDDLQQVSEMDFLKNSRSDRLRYVTIGNISEAQLLSDEVDEIEINFTFNGRFNRDLYRSTTAGMILPEEIRAVTTDGVKYSRNPHFSGGEFFSENGKRLIIRDATKLQVVEKMTPENFREQFSRKIPAVTHKDPDQLIIAQESEKHGIPESLIIAIFGEEISQVKNLDDKKVILEELFTEIDRKKGRFFLQTGKNAMN